MTTPDVYLLAAGRGRRAGGPKAWQDHDGEPLLVRHVEFLRRHLPSSTVTISIQPDWLARCRDLDERVTWVPVDPDAAPLGALLLLLDTVPLSRWSFVYHVDMPLWEARLFDELLAHVPTAETQSADAIVPTHEGRGGHPVLVSPRAAASLMRLDPRTDRLDHWLRTRRVARLPVDLGLVRENWNLGR